METARRFTAINCDYQVPMQFDEVTLGEVVDALENWFRYRSQGGDVIILIDNATGEWYLGTKIEGE